MSKSLGNAVEPAGRDQASGAEILRLWAPSVDYAEDTRIGPDDPAERLSTATASSATRFAICSARSPDLPPEPAVDLADMPRARALYAASAAELDRVVRVGYAPSISPRPRAVRLLLNDLSAFYFDVRKDALYCDPYASMSAAPRLTAARPRVPALTAWLGPMLAFTMEEAWLESVPGR